MTTPENWLLLHRLRGIAERLADADADADALWAEADRLIATAGAEEDAEIALPILDRSEEELAQLLEGWEKGTIHMAEWDKAVLARAMKAFRRRLKLSRLDDESSASRNPLSRGDSSSIAGVRPPEQYGPEIWAFLVAKGRLRDGGHGILELGT